MRPQGGEDDLLGAESTVRKVVGTALMMAFIATERLLPHKRVRRNNSASVICWAYPLQQQATQGDSSTICCSNELDPNHRDLLLTTK